jgi:glutathione transport system permease protein
MAIRPARHLTLVLGLALVGAITLAGLFAPALAGRSPYEQDLAHPFLGMSPRHLFGTDAFGRDIAMRVLYGARYSVAEAAASIAISCSVGALLGLACGAAGGWPDRIVMWLMDILYAFPGVVLALLIISLLGPGLANMLLAISLFSVPVYARLARNLALELRAAPFVEAAVTMGVGLPRIVLRHILPNAAGPILVQCAASAGWVILMAASLSFLGLGAQPPAPEWGAMISDGPNNDGANNLLSLGFNMIGEGLRQLSPSR